MARIPMQLALLSMSVLLAVGAQAQVAPQGQREAMDRLAAETGSAAQVSLDGATGAARFVRLPGAKLGAPRSTARALTEAAKEGRSAQFLADYGSLFGLRNAKSELGAARIVKDRYGGTHISHKQLYQGLPVFGAEIKTHFDAADNLVVANGTFVPGIELNPSPSRTAAQAGAAAMTRVLADLGRPAALSVARTTLMVYRSGLAKGVPGVNHLVWQVEIGNRLDVREFVYVDAHSGKVVDKITGIHDARNRRAYNASGQTAPGPNYPANPFWVEGSPFPTGTAEADNMIQASAETYELFKNAFGRDSFDGNGARMDSIFNRGDNCPNASWNGLFISFCPGLTSDDITAHEWGHAYTQYSSDLVYHWQPGALNEAYSDIWGETIDRLNGRGLDTPDAQRSANSCSIATNITQVALTAPAAIAGGKTSGSAAFGPQTFSVSATDVVVVNDAAGGSTTDGCEAPFSNGAALAGKIAFVDRGTCGFAIKVKNAQLHGAIGVIVGNNAAGVGSMGGADATITIPSLMVSQSDGSAIKAQTSAVRASLQRGPGSDSSLRWLMGEESTGFGGAIRDMWNPTCYGDPGKVSDAQYACTPDTSAGDYGGVHTNSGVPNHAYALLVDGGSYNGQAIVSIGLTKAAHIYYRAQSVYQGAFSGFSDHADALAQSCADLTGLNLAHLKTGLASGEVITAMDCEQVDKAALAVELRTPPSQCGFQSLLAKSPPALCPTGAATALLSDNFDGGKKASVRWTLSAAGNAPEFTRRNWGVVNNLPGGRPGYGIFASDPNIGTCAPGGDQTSLQRLESPEITVPAGATDLRLSFDHWVATESGYDGGNIKISVNGGAWQLLAATHFVYNAYNTSLISAAGGNSNPLAAQGAFSGSDGGSVTGSWGRSIVNLAPYAAPNDKVKLRFEMGSDGCGGVVGWYLDDVTVYRCTP